MSEEMNNNYPEGEVMSGEVNNSYPEGEKKGMSIASLVLGCLGIVAWCLPLLGYPVTIVGLILGIVGMKKGGKGLAIAGIILCSIFLLATLINSIAGAMIAIDGLSSMY